MSIAFLVRHIMRYGALSDDGARPLRGTTINFIIYVDTLELQGGTDVA